MIAASTADQMRPATNGVKRRSVMMRNTVSASVPTNLSGNMYTWPMRPTAIAAIRDKITHTMAIFVDFFNSLALEMAMNLTRI